ncbi:glycoside hydrolase family 88 protein [Oribacterium sp. WCC10]|uniref:glycoside hydrolase family 88 protein n=1 Tax=Oribacterium sp. WCC10 TaxID=1855343 RepID=UPI0008EAC68B|nr:glycoside hydrolase family 88 protein [Oribacterium sp. WCC10]SFG50957.1 unsaturated chondroitin disaccharide hydrolase [Oribacterium sp. WCC10]
MSRWITEADIAQYKEITETEVKQALDFSVKQVEKNLTDFTDHFPGPASFDGFYKPGENKNWTTGFWTGEIWLSYENAAELKDKTAFRHAGLTQVDSFHNRISQKYDVDNHDMGFLFSPSCVAAYKLTGSEKAKEAAILAAEQLVKRFHPVGEFLQAWGSMDDPKNYRFIIDCLLNLPLLYWASETTEDSKYRDIAEKHIHTTMKYILREDDSTWHTVFLDPETGGFSHGSTCQGYKDGSAWARGQAWGIYGTAVAYKYTGREEYIEYFKRIATYFLNHLPKDIIPFWDLTFGDGDEITEPRDSSSAAIAACGMLEMSKYMNEKDAAYYSSIARKFMKALYDGYRVTDSEQSNGQILHGTYSKKTPYNTCTEEGVDECIIWGDYYYMEALTRLSNPEWNIYW